MFYTPREPTLSRWFCDGKYNKSKSLFYRDISMSELPYMRQVMDVARTCNLHDDAKKYAISFQTALKTVAKKHLENNQNANKTTAENKLL